MTKYWGDHDRGGTFAQFHQCTHEITCLCPRQGRIERHSAHADVTTSWVWSGVSAARARERLDEAIRLRHHIRFRTRNRDLPGSPDIANRRRRWAVFVHGCFWHHHFGCKLATVPKQNRQFWMDKFRKNQARDARVERTLRECGFKVLVVWQCETKNVADLGARLSSELLGK